MTVDRIAVLAGYSDTELLQEIQRRREEIQQRLDLLSVPTVDKPRFSKKAEAKRAYWSEWKIYRSTHPTATVEQWQKARKKGK